MGVGELMGFGSFFVFAVAVFWLQPSKWNWESRILLGVLQIVLAFVIMIFAHLYYCLNWGIDTL